MQMKDMQVNEIDNEIVKQDSQSSNIQPSISPNIKTLTRIIAVGLLLNVILTILSFVVVNNRTQYSGPLAKYLPIHSGEIHYARLPQQYWQHRILMLKAMGLNTLSVYVMWNYHQISPNHFDFITESRNISLFLDIVKRHGMKVLLRPGPYVCAQWDFGGLPARFLGMEEVQIRSANQKYEEQVKIYFSALAPLIKPYLLSADGPILMIQIENQLGYIQNTPKHTLNLLSLWRELGIDGEFYYQDPGQLWQNNYWDGAHIGLSESSDMMKYLNIELSSKRNKNSLIFGGEVYSGWFTDWGIGWGKVDALQFSSKIGNIINHNRSVNLYMGFGGTNFGMTAGANGFNFLYSYMPHITSYDYDSPISQSGGSTDKYLMLREVFQKYHGENYKIIDIPSPLKAIKIKDISVEAVANLFANLGEASVINGDLTYFQSNLLKMYNQGLVLYQTKLFHSVLYSFSCVIRDYAIVFIDNIFVTTIQRGFKQKFSFQVKCNKAPCKLRILVQAMGHVNFGKYQGNDRKGLFDFVDNNNDKNVYKWNITKIELDQPLLKWSNKNSSITFPLLYKGRFNLSQIGDTFIDMSKWGKGYLWINKRNLGRYWNIGPQYRLYCPGVWLKQGFNQIAVLQLTNSKGSIEGFESMN